MESLPVDIYGMISVVSKIRHALGNETDTDLYFQSSSRMSRSGRQLSLFNIQAPGTGPDKVIQ